MMNKVWIRVAAVLFLLLLATGTVSAHAKLVKANPAPGAVVGQPPSQVQLWYDEQIEPEFSEVQVLDKSRGRADTGTLQLASDDPESVIVPLKPLSDGTYSVVWKVLSATDGHVTRGVFAFSVGQVSGPVVAPSDVATTGGISELTPVSATTRGLTLIALLGLVGGFFFRLFLLDRALNFVGVNPGIVERRWRQLITVALALAFVGSAIELVLEANLVAAEISVQSVADVLFDTRTGALWIIRVFLLIVIATLLFARTRRARIAIPALSLAVMLILFFIANALSITRGIFLSKLFSTQGLTQAQAIYLYLHHFGLFLPFAIFFGIAFYQKYDLRGLLPIIGAIALLTLALGSHGAATEGDFSLATLSDWIHLLAVSVWVGGLFHFVFLMPFIWRQLDEPTRGKWIAWLIPQFSNAAIISTGAILITGIYNSYLEIPAVASFITAFKLPSLNDLVSSQYVDTLAIKVALFGVMIGFGAINLLILTPRFRRSVNAPQKNARLFSRFRVSTGAEVFLGLTVIFLAGMLTLEPPARSEVAPSGSTVAQTSEPARLVLKGNPASDVNVQLVAGPNPNQPTEFDAQVTDAQGQPVANILRVIFNFTMLDSDTGVQNVNADAGADGHYTAKGDYLPLDGMWRVRMTVRRKGVEDVSSEFPIYVPSPDANNPDDPQARALLMDAQNKMNTLTTLHSVQQLNDGANGVVVTDYDYQAPDKLRFNVEGQGASIAIGALQYYQDKSGQWTVRGRVDPFVFPQFNTANNGQNVELGRAEPLNQEPTQIVRFRTPDTSGTSWINYAYWIATGDHRLMQFAMVTESHYMVQYYTDFNGSDIAINQPTNVLAPTPVTQSPGTQPATAANKSGRLPGFITGDLEGDGALVLLVVGIVIGLVGTGRGRTRTARLTTLGIALACALAGIGLFVDAVNATAAVNNNAPINASQAAIGQPLYQQNCAACHGVTGKGDGPAGANLPVKPFDLTTHVLLHDEQYLYAVILNGRGYMPAFGDRLTQDQIFDVIAYTRLLARNAQLQNPGRGFTPQAP